MWQEWLKGKELAKKFFITDNTKQWTNNTENLGRPDSDNQQNRNKYLCKGCGVSCWKEHGHNGSSKPGYYIKEIKHFDLNFNEEIKNFSYNCSCGEEFKKTKQQTCSQCQKREWPDMKKGWALDYGLKLIFCSPYCHMLYHKAKWEKETGKEVNKETKIPNSVMEKWVVKAELFPMEIELSSEEGKDFDLKKESAEKRVLALKEFNIALEQKSNDPRFTFKAEQDQWEQAGAYAEMMAKSSFQKAQQTYADKYGKAELENLLTGSSQVQPPKKTNWGLIAGIGLIGLGIIGGLGYYFWNKRNKKSKQ